MTKWCLKLNKFIQQVVPEHEQLHEIQTKETINSKYIKYIYTQKQMKAAISQIKQPLLQLVNWSNMKQPLQYFFNSSKLT